MVDGPGEMFVTPMVSLAVDGLGVRLVVLGRYFLPSPLVGTSIASVVGPVVTVAAIVPVPVLIVSTLLLISVASAVGRASGDGTCKLEVVVLELLDFSSKCDDLFLFC